MNRNKILRFINSFKPIPANRKGFCDPDKCETLKGEKGAACCKLGYKCPALVGTNCFIYNCRPVNCQSFPISESDLRLVRNCTYYFE